MYTHTPWTPQLHILFLSITIIFMYILHKVIKTRSTRDRSHTHSLQRWVSTKLSISQRVFLFCISYTGTSNGRRGKWSYHRLLGHWECLAPSSLGYMQCWEFKVSQPRYVRQEAGRDRRSRHTSWLVVLGLFSSCRGCFSVRGVPLVCLDLGGLGSFSSSTNVSCLLNRNGCN